MRSSYDSEGEDHGPRGPVDAPLDGHEGRADDDDSSDENPGKEPREPEAFEYLGDFLEEVRPLDFLLRCAPRHIVREAMGQDRLRNRNREPTKKEEAARPSQSPPATSNQSRTYKKGIHVMFSSIELSCKVDW